MTTTYSEVLTEIEAMFKGIDESAKLSTDYVSVWSITFETLEIFEVWLAQRLMTDVTATKLPSLMSVLEWTDEGGDKHQMRESEVGQRAAEHMRFELWRHDDETGVSGEGHIADGVSFVDGTCVMRWRTAHRATTTYDSIKDVKAIHGHDGKTSVCWIDRGRPAVGPISEVVEASRPPSQVTDLEIKTAKMEGRTEAFAIVLEHLRARFDEVDAMPIADRFHAQQLIGKKNMSAQLIERVKGMLRRSEEPLFSNSDDYHPIPNGTEVETAFGRLEVSGMWTDHVGQGKRVFLEKIWRIERNEIMSSRDQGVIEQELNGNPQFLDSLEVV